MAEKIKFIPGSYSAKTDSLARIEATVEVDEERIINVHLKSQPGEREIEPEIENEFKGQILQAQSLKIDGVSSASVLSKAVKTAVGEALAEARTPPKMKVGASNAKETITLVNRWNHRFSCF